MSDANAARRTVLDITFDGANITESITPYLLSLDYTDNETNEADDLQIKLQDRDAVWLTDWLQKAIESASAAKLKIKATITYQNRLGSGQDEELPCGEFELDSVDASGPPATITVKCTSMPFSGQIRQTKKSKAWEGIKLSGIAGEIAGANGLSLLFDAKNNPTYDRMEQTKTSDIEFLLKLCKDAGLSLKITDGQLVIFDGTVYEAKPPVITIKKGNGTYLKYRLSTGAADTQYASCRVRYVQPSGSCIEGIAKTDDYNSEDKNNQQLEISARVTSIGEAKLLAEKHLRLHNQYTKTASFTMPGFTRLVAGVTVNLQDFGAWDGKYLVMQAKHTVGTSGYTTTVKLRKILEGY